MTVEKIYRAPVPPEVFKEPLRFVHIPKAGGNSMKPLIYASSRHKCLEGHKQAPQSENLFSLVRNPFNWLISMWHYNWPGNIRHTHGVRTIWSDLETFLYEFNSDIPCKREEWNRSGMRVADGYVLHGHRYLQTCQTFDVLHDPGPKHSYAEFYIQLEGVDAALPLLGLESRKMPWNNKSSHKDYRYYYDDKLIDHITAHREQELKLLGYNFDGPVDDLSVFKTIQPFDWNPPNK